MKVWIVQSEDPDIPGVVMSIHARQDGAQKAALEVAMMLWSSIAAGYDYLLDDYPPAPTLSTWEACVEKIKASWAQTFHEDAGMSLEVTEHEVVE